MSSWTPHGPTLDMIIHSNYGVTVKSFHNCPLPTLQECSNYKSLTLIFKYLPWLGQTDQEQIQMCRPPSRTFLHSTCYPNSQSSHSGHKGPPTESRRRNAKLTSKLQLLMTRNIWIPLKVLIDSLWTAEEFVQPTFHTEVASNKEVKI